MLHPSHPLEVLLTMLPAAHRRPRALVVWLTIGLLLAASAPSAVLADRPDGTVTRGARTAGPIVVRSVVTFYGRGYGHGVGLSQHGARGRALVGQTAAEILDHYYAGTALGSISTATPIRVRVLPSFAATSTRPVVLYGRRGDWTIDGLAPIFPKDARLTVTPTTKSGVVSWRLVIKSAAGTTLHDASTNAFRIRPATASGTIEVSSRSSSYDEYRGVIRVRITSTSQTLNVINELPIETYLRGVVPAEMPSTWPTEALRAQAIAARSYAARRLRPGVSYYDMNDDSSSQVYLGREAEKATTDTAISGSAGVVVRNGSAIANTLFHSAGGGATENNENVFVSATGKKVASPVSYLRGSPDRAPDGSAYDKTSPYATWKTSALSRGQLSAIFARDPRTDVGSLQALDLRDRGVSGRLIRVVLYGSKSSKTVSGDVFRTVYNAYRPSGTASMRSTLVDTAPIP